MRARTTALLELLKGSGEWRYFREGLAELGYEYPDRGNPELEDALVGLARELLPYSLAARWDEEWASSLCKDVLARFAERCAGLTAAEMETLDLSAQDVWDERMCLAAQSNNPAAFRAALKGWEQAGLEAIERARAKGGAA